MNFRKPYSSKLNLVVYNQDVFEVKLKKLKKTDTNLVVDKTVSLQDDLNLHRDVNSIYSLIDKFQSDNSKMGKLEEAVEFMRKVGKDPEAVFNGEYRDLSWLPDNFNDLFKTVGDLKQVYDQYKEYMKQADQQVKQADQQVKQADQQVNQSDQQVQKVGDSNVK